LNGQLDGDAGRIKVPASLRWVAKEREMVTHIIPPGEIKLAGQGGMIAVTRVKTAAELREALQRKEPFAFDNDRLERYFTLFTKWWIPAALAAYIVHSQTGVAYRYREWTPEKTIEHSLILIPKR
jgi:hypothetical protein